MQFSLGWNDTDDNVFKVQGQSNFSLDTDLLKMHLSWLWVTLGHFSLQLLNAIQLFGANLDDYLHLLLPPIVKLFDAPDVPVVARK